MNPTYTTTGSEQPAMFEPQPPQDPMGAALALLLEKPLKTWLNLDACAFLSGGFIAGASLTSPAGAGTPYDNLSASLTGRLKEISRDGCAAGIEGNLYYALPETTPVKIGFAAAAARLPALDACAVSAAGTTESEKKANLKKAVEYLQKRLLPPGPGYRCSGRPLPPPPPAAPVSLTACRLLLGNAENVGLSQGVRFCANDCACRLYLIRACCTGFCGEA
jgi:hypothetical protein